MTFIVATSEFQTLINRLKYFYSRFWHFSKADMTSTNVHFSVGAHLMVLLGAHPEGVDFTTLVSSVKGPENTVGQVLDTLCRSGLIIRNDSRSGACLLLKDPEHLTLLDIYHATNAGAELANSPFRTDDARQLTSFVKAAVSDVLLAANAGFEARLAKRTLADLIADVLSRT